MAVTKAQIEAVRAANAAFKAAQASGNTAKAQSIVSNTAKALWVSTSSSTYKNLYSQASNIKPTPAPTPAPTPTNTNNSLYNPNNITNPPTYNLGNLGDNPYWDVRVWTQGRQTYTGEGIKLSTWDIITDKSAIWDMTKINDYLKFWKEAEQIESQNKWFLAARNDAIIMDIFKNNPKITQENIDKIIIDYIKAKDPGWTFNTWTEWQAAVNNTLAAIKSRMWYIPSEKEDLTKKAEDAFDREIADIKSQYEAEKSAFMKAGAIEDRYTNFNEVNDRINRTLEAAGKHRAENLYTGMPTDQQIWEIAQSLWQDFATTKKIMEWRGYEDLEMQDEFKEKSERPYERMFEDLELNRSRTLADIETKHVRTQTALNEQVDDVKTQMERTLAAWEKAWALSWAIRSSGYVQWLDNIRQDAIKNMDRLKVRKDWDTEDTAMNKGRVIEDFNINMTRAKQDLETTLNEIKITNGAALWQYLNEYAPSSSELTRKLNELEDKFAIKSQQAFQMYTQNLRGITDTMTYNTEKVLQIEWMKQQLQQTNVNNLLANNGMALAWINYWDLSTMLKSWDISPTDYTAMAGYMKTLGISQLQSMWIPAPQDFALYNQMLEQGMTPQQAISAVVNNNPDRFQKAAKWGEWKLDSNSWMFYRTWADGNLEFSEFPQMWQAPSNYVPADQTQMQEWLVFLYGYKDWDQAPRDWYCWQFVNDYLKSMWITNENLFIDPITEKKKYVNSSVPKVGSVMIMDSKTSPQYWHVAVVESINEDWTINIKEANWNGDKKIHTRTVDPNNMGVAVHGFFDPTLQWVGWWGWTEYNGNILWPQYDRLTPSNQSIVKWLLDYNITLPPRNADYNKIIWATMEANPEWSDVTYKERYDFKKVWNKSLIGWGNLSKVATAVQHLRELENLAKQLKWQSNLQIKNSITNWAKEKLWDPNITSFDAAVWAVTSELAWAYKWNASPSESDREEWSRIVWKKLSPKQIEAYVNTAAHLLFWKINTEAEAYYRTMWEKPASIFTQDWFDYLKSKWLNVDYYFKSPERDWWLWVWTSWWTTSTWPVTLSDIFR